MSKSKGSRWERHYRNAFNAEGEDDEDDVDRVGTSLMWVEPFFAMRVPSSGSAYGGDLPDVHVWYNDTTDATEPPKQYAAEVKAGRDRVRITKGADLRRYAKKTGSTPIAIVHLDYEGDFVFGLDEMHRTDSGSYTVTKARDADDARTFDDFVRSPGSVV